ncbi:MAG: hypothetical protein WAN86_17935 [Hyphomicrobiaceae bacterium]
MPEPSRLLTIDEALSEFQAVVQEELGDPMAGESLPPETAAEAEARRFRMAEFLCGLACPDPTRCADQRCRRDRLCRHLGYIKMKESAGRSGHPRRTPGAEAVRYAIRAYMSSGR